MKKNLFVIFCIAFATFSIVSAGSIIGTLSYWHSDDSRVGWWSPSATYATTGTANVPSGFYSSVTSAYNAWSSPGVSNSYTSSFDSAGIKIYGGLYSEIKNIYFYFPTDATGHSTIAMQYVGNLLLSDRSDDQRYTTTGTSILIIGGLSI